MISMLNVTKIYKNGHEALTGLNLEIDDGEFVFICGPSGAGKSTFIKLLLREEPISGGTLIVNDRNLGHIRRKELLRHRREIGMVFQDYRLLPKKNAFENIAYAMEVTEQSKRDIRKRVPEVLELVGLADKADAFPDQLSGGEQQRVAIARALVNRPSILIADEPTGNLDPQNAWDLMDLFSCINDRGTTIIMATHAKDIVDEMRKRVIMIDSGHIVYDQKGGFYYEGSLL